MSDVATAKKAEAVANEASTSASASAGKGKMPGASDFDLTKGAIAAPAVSGQSAATDKNMTSDERERNVVFGSLVKGDEDIVGLVAYSIYKQNKHDWLVSFNKIKSREPDESEAGSYILGESTTRRLAIYRHLAEATLEGRGPQVSGGPAKEKFVQHSLAKGNAANQQGGGVKAIVWIIGLVAVAAAFYAGAKYGLPGVTG